MQTDTFEDGIVSIITPVYNSSSFIEETIESVIAQSLATWELLLIDDCSNDQSPVIIDGYTKRDRRIRTVRLERNSGAAAARNRGLMEARGRYVAFVDSDDLWTPLKLEKQLRLMRASGAGFCYTAIEMIDENDSIIKPQRPIKPVVDYSYLLSNTVIACSSVVIDRLAMGDFRMPNVRKGQDFATWLMLLRGGEKAYGIDETLVRYRVARGSISSNKLGALKRTWHIYRDQEHLRMLKSVFYFSLYTLHAVKKYFF